jgi:hypothetical protein
LVGNLGTVLLWNESAAAIGNASNLYIGAKSGAGATTFGGSYISAGIENASDRSGFFALSTFQSNGIDRERYRIDSTGVHTWQYVGGVAGTAMTLNSTGLGVGVTPSSAKLEVNGAGRFSGFGVNSIGLNTTGTAQNFVRFTTAGADCYIGTESSVAGGFFTGSTAYATCIYNASNTPIQFFTNGSVKATLTASGDLLVGQTVQSLNVSGASLTSTGEIVGTVNGGSVLYVNRLTSDGTVVDLRRQSSNVGNISVTTTGATFNSISDYRLKESVAPLSGGLARVNALKPSIYKWKSNGSDGEGFLAHELAEVVPLAVTGEKDAVNEDGSIKPQGVDLSRVVPILVAAINELTARVEALEA